ncbi:MAG: response regulator [Planctomycetota bacterium]|nr:MAG: response regulator [Planctomycetota bacterium]
MTPRVLVLDNDSSLAELLELALGRGGCEARVHRRAETAEAELRREGADFLVLDLNLGGGHSGERLARRWAEEGILPPFLLLTGTPEDPRLAGLVDLPGFHGVQAKPFSILALVETIRGVCASIGEARA